jgi:hypothetical protein
MVRRLVPAVQYTVTTTNTNLTAQNFYHSIHLLAQTTESDSEITLLVMIHIYNVKDI